MLTSKRSRKGGDIACIFVHAGAGYHSVQNENIHLQACNDAAKAAMSLLRNGGSALDAVEIAVKVLEDREITNAGYGSNLAVDGVVECDAVVVDHHGRSGGVGATAQIKNPISLARLLLDHTARTLSLRRVPPNFLAGQGAVDFAYEHDMPVLPLDCLISPAARDRWRRWRDDLDRAERNRQREEAERHGISPVPSEVDLAQYCDFDDEPEQMRRAHTKAMRAATWNEAQPLSPPPSDNRVEMLEDSSSPSHTASPLSAADAEDMSDTAPDPPDEYTDPYGPPGMLKSTSRNPFANSTQKIPTPASFERPSSHMSSDGSAVNLLQLKSTMRLADVRTSQRSSAPISHAHTSVTASHDGSSGSDTDGTTVALHLHSPRLNGGVANKASVEDAALFPLPETPPEKRQESPTPNTGTPLSHIHNAPPLPPDPNPTHMEWLAEDDKITDTVGAIAVDMYGNVACGASSGGIGMKHRGRVGPAALVGIGAAVIPIDGDDPECTSVATVTSGTGEHMGTTMAAGTCSDRMYQSVRKVPGGGYEECGDDEAIKGFIEKDFMGHASVKNSHSLGAIGILSVKRTKHGTWLYFGHNTDSFALASMHADETKPVCTMSRSRGNGVIAQGGRAIRYRKRRP